MSFHLITAENIRDPLEPILDSVIEKHIAHRLVDDFLILTPDEAARGDLTKRFLEDPRLGGVLTGKSLLSFPSYLSRILEEEGLSAAPAPAWLHEALFFDLAKKRKGKFPDLSLSSLYQLISAFRMERRSQRELTDFVRNFDPELAAVSGELFEEFQSLLKRHPQISDGRDRLEEFLRALSEGQMKSFTNLKTLYWLGFTHLPPFAKAVMEGLHQKIPELEQIVLLQIAQGQDVQDMTGRFPFEKMEIYPFRGPTSRPTETRFLEFPGPFDEAAFLLERTVEAVQGGMSPEEICLSLPPEPFWLAYFSSELSKLNLFSMPANPRPLASFQAVAANFSLSVPEAIEQNKKRLEESLKEPSLCSALEKRALAEWQKTLEEIHFYERELAPSLSISFSLPKIGRSTYLTEKNVAHRGIQLRGHKKMGVHRFGLTMAFQMSDRYLPRGPERFFGMPLPDTARAPAAERGAFQHLIGSASEDLILSFSRHSVQGEETAASPYLAEFGFFGAEPKRHRPFFFTRGQENFKNRLKMEIQRVEDPSYRHPFGGWIQDPKIKAALFKRLSEQVFTPTQLENYAECPFKFFAGNLLGLKPPLEKTPEGTAGERGEWMHRFLEAFFSGHREEILRAAKDRTLRSSLQGKLGEELEKLSQAFLKERPWIHEILSEDFIRRAIGVTEELLEISWETLSRSERPFLPTLFEARFGENSPLSFERPGQPPLKIRGRIDRVDVTADGKEFLVFDYKTGETQGISQRIREGKGLQLPIYLLAAEQMLQEAPHVKPSARGALALSLKDLSLKEGLLKKEEKERLGFKGRTALWEEAEWKAYWEKLEKILLDLHARMLAGDFRTAPDPCDPFCDFKNICRYHERAKPHF